MLAVNDRPKPSARTFLRMTEQQGGIGDVFEKESLQYIGTFPYLVTITRSTEGGIEHIEADIGLDRDNAARAKINGTPLVLRMQDGRCFDFLVLPTWGHTVTATVRT